MVKPVYCVRPDQYKITEKRLYSLPDSFYTAYINFLLVIYKTLCLWALKITNIT